MLDSVPAPQKPIHRRTILVSLATALIVGGGVFVSPSITPAAEAAEVCTAWNEPVGGSVGSTQGKIQQSLKDLGLYTGIVDGVWGSLSRSGIQQAVARWQGYQGRTDGSLVGTGVATCAAIQNFGKSLGYYGGPVDGILGPNSWTGFYNALESKKVKPAATSVSISPAVATVAVGSSVTLKATVLPSGADQSVTWLVDKTNATVSGGVVTGKSVGQVVVTAKTGNSKSATATVNVVAVPTPTTACQWALPAKATQQKIQQALADHKLYSGVIDGDWGELSISAIQQALNKWQSYSGSTSGKNPGSDTCSKVRDFATQQGGYAGSVTKLDNSVWDRFWWGLELKKPAATSVVISSSGVAVGMGGSVTVKAVVAPAAASQYVSWSINTQAYATVASGWTASGGMVTGVTPGTATITVRTINGKTATVPVVVTKALCTTAASCAQYIKNDKKHFDFMYYPLYIEADFTEMAGTGKLTSCGTTVAVNPQLMILLVNTAVTYDWKIGMGSMRRNYECGGFSHQYGTAIDLNELTKIATGAKGNIGGEMAYANSTIKAFLSDLNAVAKSMGIKFGVGQVSGNSKYGWPNINGRDYSQWNGRLTADPAHHIHLEVCRTISGACK